MKYLNKIKKLSHEELLLYSLLLIVIMTTILFLIIYMIWVPFWPARIVHIVYLLFHFTLIVALRKKQFLYVKLSIILTNIIQLTLATFLWFPLTTNYELFYFLLPMGSFVIFDITKKTERNTAIGFSVLSLTLFFLARFSGINFYIFELDSTPTKIISFFTIISTMTILIIYFFLHAYFLAQKRMELEYLANTDSLTKINNRRNFYNLSKLEFDLAHKYNHTFSLLLLDIDHFKNINDSYGHDVGDDVLKAITKTIKDNIRAEDIFARHGGEEFTLLLRNTDQETGFKIAEKLRNLVSNLQISSHNHVVSVTVSIGVVQFSKEISEFDSLINKADKALYQAKELGRNQCVLFK